MQDLPWDARVRRSVEKLKIAALVTACRIAGPRFAARKTMQEKGVLHENKRKAKRQKKRSSCEERFFCRFASYSAV